MVNVLLWEWAVNLGQIVPRFKDVNTAVPKPYANWKACEMQLGTVGGVSRICPKERLCLPDGSWWETPSLWPPGLMLGCFLQQHRTSPDSPTYVGGWDPCGHSQQLTSGPPAARCARACATETTDCRSDGCREEAARKLCLWGKRLSRFTFGLLKPFLSLLSYILKIPFGGFSFNCRAKHCGK